MEQGSTFDVSPGRRHIIRRPRLTRLLDESTARVILLVAPAGYGKTTLAHEWLQSRVSAWYRGDASSADIAALAQGVGAALSSIVPGAGSRMAERLAITTDPEREGTVLADLLVDDLQAWPPDSWLVLDDYHFVMDSAAAEAFVARLADAGAQILISSRRRPTWATARRLLYGELLELGKQALSMTHDEAMRVLESRSGTHIPGLVGLAEGWPAVIGLAAMLPESVLPDEIVPNALHDFFAEELFQSTDPVLQRWLCQLALVPELSADLLPSLFQGDTARLLNEAERLGFISNRGSGSYELHPLLRGFLENKLDDLAPALRETLLRATVQRLSLHKRWDDVFTLIARFSLKDALPDLVEVGLESMLIEGRLSTLHKWLGYADANDIHAPVIDFAHAELAYRQGKPARARRLALDAKAQLELGHPLRSRVLHRAGQGAYMLDRYEEAIDLHSQARREAQTTADSFNATWGQFLAAVHLETADMGDLLADLQRQVAGDPHDRLRVANAVFGVATRSGGVTAAVDEARAVSHLIDAARDPLVRTSFLTSFARALALAGIYDEALRLAEQTLLEAATYRLAFVNVNALCVKATAQLGMRHFARSAQTLRSAAALALDLGDVHNLMDADVMRIKLLIARGLPAEAAEVSRRWPHLPAKPMVGEYYASRALAHACAGAHTAAQNLAAQAAELTQAIEAKAIVLATHAIVALAQHRGDGHDLACVAFDFAQTTGNVDGFIAAYRGYPDLVGTVARETSKREAVQDLVSRSWDVAVARAFGLRVSPPESKSPLSPREAEVYRLVLQGLSNRDIARLLFISDVTVKVHVRHILAKLGARSRTELLARAHGPEDNYAATAVASSPTR